MLNGTKSSYDKGGKSVKFRYHVILFFPYIMYELVK